MDDFNLVRYYNKTDGIDNGTNFSMLQLLKYAIIIIPLCIPLLWCYDTKIKELPCSVTKTSGEIKKGERETCLTVDNYRSVRDYIMKKGKRERNSNTTKIVFGLNKVALQTNEYGGIFVSADKLIYYVYPKKGKIYCTFYGVTQEKEFERHFCNIVITHIRNKCAGPGL